MNRTKIEYLTHTWNPIAMRCNPISEGCANCWHINMADRFAANKRFPANVQAAYAGEGPPVLVEKRLTKPLRKKKPAVIGVQFMGDLFHEDVPSQFIAQVFDVMAQASSHTFLVLTKRPATVLSWLLGYYSVLYNFQGEFPLSNIHFGVTVENQHAADERIPLLLQTPAAVRFVSCEPLLGPIDLSPHLPQECAVHHAIHRNGRDCLRPRDDQPVCLDWAICGGESGPGARPMHPDWARSLRDQCQAADVPYFFKQTGEWIDVETLIMAGLDPYSSNYPEMMVGGMGFLHVGKKRAGRLLDGREWNEWPT